MEHSNGKIKENIKDFGEKENNTDKDYLQILMDKNFMVNGIQDYKLQIM